MEKSWAFREGKHARELAPPVPPPMAAPTGTERPKVNKAPVSDQSFTASFEVQVKHDDC